jgi:hypothetical protein
MEAAGMRHLAQELAVIIEAATLYARFMRWGRALAIRALELNFGE